MSNYVQLSETSSGDNVVPLLSSSEIIEFEVQAKIYDILFYENTTHMQS